MNVKPEIFQATKQTILKNKYEFIQIQLKEGAKRINVLKNQNCQLKAQIKQLKSKNNKTLPNKISLTSREVVENKQNKCINLAKKKNKDIEIVTDREDHEQLDYSELQEEDELKELEMKLVEQEKEREKQVLYLEDYIKMLKKVWISKQNAGQSLVPEQNISPTVRMREGKEARKSQNMKVYVAENKKAYFDMKPNNMVYSRQSINQSQIRGEEASKIVNISSLNSSNYMETSQSGSSALNSSIDTSNGNRYVIQPRRKTMSVNLNNSSGHLMGFNFGKKSINKAKKTQVSHFNTSQTNEKQVMIPNEQVSSSNYSQSILSHSNSRNSMSMFSNTGSNKSQLKRSQASKSYGKIVTKLKCKGCSVEFRPNEYYRHIEECRDFIKITLLEQKMRVEDEINQTLNLSMQEGHY